MPKGEQTKPRGSLSAVEEPELNSRGVSRLRPEGLQQCPSAWRWAAPPKGTSQASRLTALGRNGVTPEVDLKEPAGPGFYSQDTVEMKTQCELIGSC